MTTTSVKFTLLGIFVPETEEKMGADTILGESKRRKLSVQLTSSSKEAYVSFGEIKRGGEGKAVRDSGSEKANALRAERGCKLRRRETPKEGGESQKRLFVGSDEGRSR